MRFQKPVSTASALGAFEIRVAKAAWAVGGHCRLSSWMVVWWERLLVWGSLGLSSTYGILRSVMAMYSKSCPRMSSLKRSSLMLPKSLGDKAVMMAACGQFLYLQRVMGMSLSLRPWKGVSKGVQKWMTS